MIIRTIRGWNRMLVRLNYLGHMAWGLIVAMLLALMQILHLRGVGLVEQAGLLTVGVAVLCGFFLFMGWVTHDAMRSWKAIHQAHLRERPQPTKDDEEAALTVCLPAVPPWMRVI